MLKQLRSSYSGINTFPKDDIPHEQKDQEFYKAYARAIISSWYNGKTTLGFDDRERMAINRAFGSGKQDESIYINRLSPKSKPTTKENGDIEENINASLEKRKGFMNVDWRILDMASKFKFVVKGSFGKLKHTIGLDAIDPLSGAERENKKLAALVSSIFEEATAEIEKFQGTEEINQINKKVLPKNLEEVEMLAQAGGFKLTSELVMSTCLLASYKVDSRWDEDIKMGIVDDLIDQNCAAVKTTIDPYSGRVIQRPVDVMNYIQHWNRGNLHDPRFAGEIVARSLSELRPYFKESELQEIFKSVSTLENPNLDLGEDYKQPREDGSYSYDPFTVQVFEGEFISTFVEHKMARKTRKGDWVVFPADKGKEGKVKTYNTDNRISWETSAEMAYKVSMILGCDKVYNCGLADNIIRDDAKAKLNYSFIRIPGNSITERSIPVYGQVQVDWLKYQNGKARARNAGLAIEWGALSNISMGGRKMNPMEIINITNTDGDLIYRANPMYSTGMGTSAKPFHELQGGAGTVIADFIQSMDINLQMLREFNGITQAAGAQDVKPRTGLGVMELQISSTENALYPLLQAYETLMTTSAEKSYKLIQNVFKAYENPEDNPYRGNLSVTGLRVADVVASCSRQKFGMIVKALPSDAEKDEIMGAALESMKAKKTGEAPGITTRDFIIIGELIRAGNIERAKLELQMREAKDAEAMAEQRAQAVQQQSQAIMDQQKSATEENIKLEEEKSRIKREEAEAIAQAQKKAELEKERELSDILLSRAKQYQEAGLLELLTKEKI